MPRENRCVETRCIERIDASYVMRINHEIHFAWQAQYLVKVECDFSWLAQRFVKFWEIAGARNVVFFNTKSSPRLDE